MGALEKLTEAVKVGCASAMLLSRRAQVLMQLDRPRAAARDCTAALEVNPDSAKAFKIRARANLKLEKLEEAHSDFQTALKIDYDEQTYEDSLEVEAKAKEMRASETSDRVKAEEAEYHRKLQESKDSCDAHPRATNVDKVAGKSKSLKKLQQKEEDRAVPQTLDTAAAER